MNEDLVQVKTEVYDKCELILSDFKSEEESKAYGACRFELNGLKIINRSSKITPKKGGQFVTFWKRNSDRIIEPFEEIDSFDFYVVNARTEKAFGQFVFPKWILAKKGIISTVKKEGKRAFRVYPNWDRGLNKQAERTQKWQMDYFYEINNATNFKKVMELYQK